MCNNDPARGFAALITVLVISAILITLTLSTSTASFLARADMLDAEYAEQAESLARGCIQVALLRLAFDPSYLASSPGDGVQLDQTHVCTIVSISMDSNSDLLVRAAGKSGEAHSILEATIRPRPSAEALDPGVPGLKILSIRKVSSR